MRTAWLTEIQGMELFQRLIEVRMDRQINIGAGLITRESLPARRRRLFALHGRLPRIRSAEFQRRCTPGDFFEMAKQ